MTVTIHDDDDARVRQRCKNTTGSQFVQTIVRQQWRLATADETVVVCRCHSSSLLKCTFSDISRLCRRFSCRSFSHNQTDRCTYSAQILELMARKRKGGTDDTAMPHEIVHKEGHE